MSKEKVKEPIMINGRKAICPMNWSELRREYKETMTERSFKKLRVEKGVDEAVGRIIGKVLTVKQIEIVFSIIGRAPGY